MLRFSLLSLFLLPATTAWVAPSARMAAIRPFTLSSALHMAIDYNDPVVAEEFANVQPMAFEDVEAELMEKGIPVSPALNEMDVKLMLVEMRLRFAGKLAGQEEKKQPTTFKSKLEEYTWTKPAFAELYNGLKSQGDTNAINVISEYVSNKEQAVQRYGKDYKALIRKIEAALTAPPPVKSNTLKFSGFPANMGEAACVMTLESIGTIVDFECQEDDDFPILTGKVTFEDIESAKKAVEQYNGMDMGMGTKLEMTSV